MSQMNVKVQYPRSDEYEFETFLERLNLDDERKKDLIEGNGFIITASKAIKDDMKDYNGIFSTRFGQSLQDVNPFANRYKCKCGHLQSRFYKGCVCEICGTKVDFVDDNFSFFGWLKLKDPYHVIHPNLFRSLEFLIGAVKLNSIIMSSAKKDQDGNDIEIKKPKDEPFFGIGMTDFYDRFDEILEYYAMKNPNKANYVEDIINNRDKLFVQSIPVYTTHLRPYRLEGGTLHFEGTNALYNMMSRLTANINVDLLKIQQKSKPKNDLLYDLQTKYNALYAELINTISGKKGSIRSLFGGRYNFTARSVIVPSPKLRIDEITLSYQALLGLNQQIITNILHKSYNMTYEQAYKFIEQSQMIQNPLITEIIRGLIRDSGRGLPVLINRNPM